MEHIVVDVPVSQLCGAGLLPRAVLAAFRGAWRCRCANGGGADFPQGRKTADGTLTGPGADG